MEIKPIKDMVYLAKNKKDTKTASGIELDLGQENGVGGNTWHCTVLGIGPDTKTVKIGDVCIVNWHKAHEIDVEGKKRVMVSEKEILMLIEE
jgi:co-chaperonin GroES (HSP10)